MTHPFERVLQAQQLSAQGLGASAIARRLGVPRSTIRTWLDPSRCPSPPRPAPCPRCNDRVRIDETAYVHLLGLYLGDGTVSRMRNGVWRLRIFQTAEYERLIRECVGSMAAVLPNRVNVLTRQGDVEISSYSTHWPCLFPQVGPGPKHSRPIVLADWQRTLVDRHPQLLVRGLVESDGCRDLNWATARGRRYEYPRYSFCNASDDIRRIFTDALDRLAVHWTQPSARVISIARRADVAFLDTFIGPKS